MNLEKMNYNNLPKTLIFLVSYFLLINKLVDLYNLLYF